MTHRRFLRRMARFTSLGCVYAFGVAAIVASGGIRWDCPPNSDQRKPLIGVRLVEVTPSALPGQQVVTVDRTALCTGKQVRYVPRGTITVVDNEIQFAFGFSALDVTSIDESGSSHPLSLSLLVRNGSSRGITIDWNAVTVIDASGRAYGVIHRGVKMADRSAILAPSTIPPGAVLEDFVYPKELLSFFSGRYGSGWMGVHFFEMMQPPQRFKLYLPIKYGNDTVEYQFIFAVGAPET
jgi:hypothetical protein